MNDQTQERVLELLLTGVITFQLTFLAYNGTISGQNAFYGLIGIAAGYGYYKAVRASDQSKANR